MQMKHCFYVTIATVIVSLIKNVYTTDVLDVFRPPERPPSFLKQPPKEALYQYYELTKLECLADGYPSLKYRWIRNNIPFSMQLNDGRYTKWPNEGTLIIAFGGQDDDGIYQCVAENSLGTAVSNKVNLRRADLRKFDDQKPNTITATRGQYLYLQCRVPAIYPIPIVSWVQDTGNGHLFTVTESTRRALDFDGTLHIAAVTSEDAGVFRCAVNSLYHRSQIHGSPHRIIVTPTMDNRNAQYHTNRIWNSPTKQLGLINDTVILKCIFSGNPVPKYSWTKGGQSADYIQDVSYLRVTNGGTTLFINVTSKEAGGMYTCTGSNEIGGYRPMSQFDVKVESRPVFTEEPMNTVLPENTSHIFRCAAVGEPMPQIRWLINGQDPGVYLDGVRRRMVMNSIHLDRLTLSDSAVFQCNASNSHGYVFTNAYLHVMRDKPSFLALSSANISASEGSTVNIDCRTYSAPPARVTWTRDGKRFSAGRYVFSDAGHLTINNVTHADAGTYECTARSPYGVISRNITLEVFYRTRIFIAPRDTYAKQHSSMKLVCTAEGDPMKNLTISWYKDGHLLDPRVTPRIFMNLQDNSLILSGVQSRDTGIYTCNASSELDFQHASALLVVQGRPDPPSQLQVNCAADKAQRKVATLSWHPGAENHSPVVHYLVEYAPIISRRDRNFHDSSHGEGWFPAEIHYSNRSQLQPGMVFPDERTCEIILRPNMRYKFRVKARNHLGYSEPSQPVDGVSTQGKGKEEPCQLPPEVPASNPQDLFVYGTKMYTLIIQWGAMSPIEYNGEDFGYEVTINCLDCVSQFPANCKQHVSGSNNRLEFSGIIHCQGIATGRVEKNRQYEVSIKARNERGESHQQPTVARGLSGGEPPSVIPQEVFLVHNWHDKLTLQWRHISENERSQMNGEFQGYRIEWCPEVVHQSQCHLNGGYQDFTFNNGLEGTSRGRTRRDASHDSIWGSLVRANVTKFPGGRNLRVQVRVLSRLFAGPPSDSLLVETEVNAPHPVENVKLINIGVNHAEISWQMPKEMGGGKTFGYKIGFSEVFDNLDLGMLTQYVSVLNYDQTHGWARVDSLKPGTKYRIFVWAINEAAISLESFIDVKTSSNQEDPSPPSFVIETVGHNAFNVTFEPSHRGVPGSTFVALYRKVGDNVWSITPPVYNQRWIYISLLESDTLYEVCLLASNGLNRANSSNVVVAKTDGMVLAKYPLRGNNALWFAMVIMLLILLIVVAVALVRWRQKREETLMLRPKGKKFTRKYERRLARSQTLTMDLVSTTTEENSQSFTSQRTPMEDEVNASTLSDDKGALVPFHNSPPLQITLRHPQQLPKQVQTPSGKFVKHNQAPRPRGSTRGLLPLPQPAKESIIEESASYDEPTTISNPPTGSIASHSQSNSSNSSKRVKSAQYRTVSHKSHIDESLFGESHRKVLTQRRSQTPTPGVSGKWVHDSCVPNDDLFGTVSGKQNCGTWAQRRTGLPPRAPGTKSRRPDGPETIQVVTKDMIRELRVIDPLPDESSVVIPVDTYLGIRERSIVRSAEEIEEERQRIQQEKQRAMEESEKRRRYFKQLDQQRIKKEKLTDLEDEARQKAQFLIQKAYEQRQDEEDEIKNLNEMILNAKIQAIRDAQIVEKAQIRKELLEEERRLDHMVEVERKNAIAVQAAIDEKRRAEEKFGAMRVLQQIEENEKLRLLDLQRKDEENRAQKAYIEKLMEEQYQRKIARKRDQDRKREEFKAANLEMMQRKEKDKEIDKIIDQQVLEYQKQKAEREAQFEREQERIKMEKEREVARLRSLQQRARDEQAERDELRARRAMEEAEREWRRKELDEARKKQEVQEDLERARKMQAAQKEYHLALQAARDRQEFENVLRAQRELIEKDLQERHEIEKRRSNYSQEVREQIREKERDKILERNEFFEEGKRLTEDLKMRQMRLQEAKERKLNELRSVGIPERYLLQVERKVHQQARQPMYHIMGDSTVDPAIVKKTQDTLGRIISKPPLTEKLLQKPPFRFLHDICTAVIKKTGFMNGLFANDEMVSENVKDRDAKVAFLQKVIDMVTLVNGRPLAVRPSSIISGKECDLTNELLQSLAEAINRKVDNDAYVAKVLRGEAANVGTSSKKEKEKDHHRSSKEKSRSGDTKEEAAGDRGHRTSEKDKEKERSDKDKERERRHHSKDGERRSSIDAKEKPDRESKDRPRDRDRDREKDRGKDEKDSKGRDRGKESRDRDREREKEKEKERDKERSKDRQRNGGEKEASNVRSSSDRNRRGSDDATAAASSSSSKRNDAASESREKRSRDRENEQRDEEELSGGQDGGDGPMRLPRPASAKGHRRRKDDGDARPPLPAKPYGDSDDPRRSQGRPPTARHAPPKPRRTSEVNPEDAQRITSSGGGGKVSGLIIEREQDSDDDQFVVEETIGGALDSGIDMRGSGGLEVEDPEKGEHGGLVQKMLQSKKSYEGGSQTVKTETEKSVSLDDAARKRDRIATEKEVERIRNSLQTLTRSANPLAKVMDFIQEDLDAMQRELERWRKENKDLGKRLKQEQSITDSRTDPLKTQLQDVEHVIKQQMDAIALMKSKIAANDEKIHNMLTSVSSQS